MPKRKKSSLSKRKKHKESVAVPRKTNTAGPATFSNNEGTSVAQAEETEEQHAQKQATDCTATAAVQADVNLEQCTSRQARNHTSIVAARAEGNPKQRASRQARDRISTAAARVEENPEHHASRQARERTVTAAARVEESPEHRASRQARDRTVTAGARVEENPEHRASRQARDHTATAAARADETQHHQMARITQVCHAAASRTRANSPEWNRAGFIYQPDVDYQSISILGCMSITCADSGAKKWKAESKGMCCSDGKVKLGLVQMPPEPLKSLVLGQTPESKHFLTNIRKYKGCLCGCVCFNLAISMLNSMLITLSRGASADVYALTLT
uniref:Uncharacterized protein LOC116947003 n=1 Tax=Petromyzon marinus TaxID=7757 RepID=A0AAJ7TIX1_PETMA|nr:uncharacterized protein LOC116947003 [Petromyzon marinus]XP_032818231.1 uncharacterized protein LOC116947003 [Petromyzon marinus]XP_032818233.1 uncharacterized protein LOC116947003 [Petromyzon marinus]XP_032818234.1 uncharacterized protein LOC116947003 [Petromyzon marinus]XP_032818235.1 uncharacterized protein LOC116947003 [Petromyzon marinus]XP_032818236.1 uncharacterized protein LOC116947003 [Petromyzon marinus]